MPSISLYKTVERTRRFCQTRPALKQHTIRVVCQWGCVWTLVLSAVLDLPNLEVWGWVHENDTYIP